MSIIDCRECGQPAPDLADFCPSCGASDPDIFRHHEQVSARNGFGATILFGTAFVGMLIATMVISIPFEMLVISAVTCIAVIALHTAGLDLDGFDL